MVLFGTNFMTKNSIKVLKNIFNTQLLAFGPNKENLIYILIGIVRILIDTLIFNYVSHSMYI